MAAFDFPIVPGRPWPDQLVRDSEFLTECIHGMHAVSIAEVCELSTVVGLDDFRLVPEIDDCTLDEVLGRVTALLLVRVDESFAGLL